MARRRRKPRNEHAAQGKDSFIVRTPGGEKLNDTAWPMVALVLAQGRAIKGPAVLCVERRSLVGPPVVLYRVERDDCGIVTTTTVNEED